MKERDKFIDWAGQIDLLQHHYNLQIESSESAILTIKKYSFQRLIHGYLPSLADPLNENRFMTDISIETLGVIQMLENRLSSELLQAIIAIEKNMKSLFQHAISAQLGSEEKDYLNPKHYLSWKTNRYQTLAALVNTARNDRQVSFQLKQSRKKQNVPPWVLIDEITFGQFMHWYMMSPLSIKEAVVEDFSLPFSNRQEQLGCFKEALTFLVSFRNGLAHGGLISQIKSKARLHFEHLRPFYSQIISEEEFNQAKIGQRDLFGLLLVIGIFLKQSERQLFKDQLLNLLAILDSLLPLNEPPMQRLLGNTPDRLIERVQKIL
ncbi:Abi family protein [Fructobacillus sp. M158]|uniref:Abi family protein n=1 Tax=Fructobacillus parabroussonetiae TaxID=2713174 RepID=UPI00200A2763|nr:Abi family protein [Fructobacillus parabroussonetiae]MCK8617572.1 Abi family protein [Fructobacillus parabroussonetiae]